MFFGLLVGICALFPSSSSAAGMYDTAIQSSDIEFSPRDLIFGIQTRIYVKVRNQGERDVEGMVHFSIDQRLIGSKPFSVRAGGSPEEVWIRWTPEEYGNHKIQAIVENDGAYSDRNSVDNQASETVYIDRDTDGDGVPDRLDVDADDDGVLNTDEERQKTDPLKKDTDGDRVDDLHDELPLDPTRSVRPPPVVVVPEVVQPPKAEQPPTKQVVKSSAPTIKNPSAPPSTRAATPTSSVAPTVPVPVPSVSVEQIVTSSSSSLMVTTTASEVTTSPEPVTSSPSVIQTDVPLVPTTSSLPPMTIILIMATVLSVAGALAFAWLALGASA